MRTLSPFPTTQCCVYKCIAELLVTPINTVHPAGFQWNSLYYTSISMYPVSQFPKSALDIILSPAAVHFIIRSKFYYVSRGGLFNLLTSISCTLSSHCPELPSVVATVKPFNHEGLCQFCMSTVAWASMTSLCVCAMISREDLLSSHFWS